ncbi:MAG: DedA family protein [Deltaproteobacteria bacterium]|nr:DedA family protein [Deltaproteobacteria bacterium]
MELLQNLFDIFFHLDTHLNEWAGMLGPWLYALLFLILFCETGLVVTPVLPGDSLLFAVGALISLEGSPLSLPLMLVLLCTAAITGDAVNYAIGYRVGPKVFSSEESWLLNKRHLLRTEEFYEKHGGKTIILARFMPIIRTFAPFVAGIGKMGYARFAAFNVVGGIAWVLAFVLGGYYFGNVPAIKRNFHYVIVAIVILSVLPPVIEYLRSRRAPSVTPALE